MSTKMSVPQQTRTPMAGYGPESGPLPPPERGASAERETMILNMGPQHPSTHGVLRVIVELDGETVVKATPDIGYLHTGIEKTSEHKLYQQVVTLVDRMDYVSPMTNNLGYVLAVEKLLDLEIPPRAQVIRVLFAELQRIVSHLVWLGTHALDLGAMSVYFYCFEQREQLLDMFEAVSGARMNTNYFRVGGVSQDLPPEFDGKMRRFLAEYDGWIGRYYDLLLGNRIWIERLRDVGKINAEQAIAYGLSGPCLRGSGVRWDVRKAHPYCGYENYSFEIPVGDRGDVYDRYLVRMRELEESGKIVRQAFERLPGGKVWVEDPKIAPPPKETLSESMEALIHHFKLYTSGFTVPAGDVYHSIEAPKGELGFYLVSGGGNKPYRLRVRPPSFYNLQAMSVMAEGGLLADVVAIIGSVDILLGEVDR